MVLLLLFQAQPLLDVMQPKSMGLVMEHCLSAEPSYKPETAVQEAQLSILKQQICTQIPNDL